MQWLRLLFILALVGCLNLDQSSAESCQSGVESPQARSWELDALNPVDPHNPGIILTTNGGERTQNVIWKVIEAVENEVPVQQFGFKTPWIRDWFPLLVNKNGQLKQIVFRPTKNDVRGDSDHQVWWNEESGIPSEKVDVVLDIGNLVTDGHTAFITKSATFLRDNAQVFGIGEVTAAARIKAALNMDVVYLPEVSDIHGHSDLYLAYVGKGRFVVSASHRADQQQGLDEVAEIVGRHGTVTRVFNPSLGDRSNAPLLTYAQVIVVQNKIVIPGYSEDANFWLRNPTEQDIQTFVNNDLAAVKAYQNLGFEVVQIQMRRVPELLGMIHCMFRALPKDVFELLPAKISELWLSQSRYRHKLKANHRQTGLTAAPGARPE